MSAQWTDVDFVAYAENPMAHLLSEKNVTAVMGKRKPIKAPMRFISFHSVPTSFQKSIEQLSRRAAAVRSAFRLAPPITVESHSGFPELHTNSRRLANRCLTTASHVCGDGIAAR